MKKFQINRPNETYWNRAVYTIYIFILGGSKYHDGQEVINNKFQWVEKPGFCLLV